MVLELITLADVSDIFYFFCSGEGGGSPGRCAGAGGEGPGGCLRGIWGGG